ncbi:hypothetical protein AB1Y20_020401 [Prymnesium parvum]|uniref:Chitin-binding type-4 domain-containing protein n=1 Tax=Prymnesium parvum TaxID=97485 RepID=A0AB34JUJ4_PRYPA
MWLLVLSPGHGSLVSPRSRNSVDYLVHVNEQPCANLTGSSCFNGQASFWYSQGCFIGCPTCDHKSGRVQADVCGRGKQATVNDPAHRSVNRNATAGSKLDIYRHNPWRSPGSAPVADACGLAGGTPWGADVAEEGVYINTSFGMRGSALRPLPDHTAPAWARGGEVEVTWQIRNNHGGGYQYRLCPAGAALSEACFQAHPLEFVRERQALVFANGTRLPIEGVFVDEGTSPAGSTWSMLPIPPTWLGPRCVGPGCESWEDHLVDGPSVLDVLKIPTTLPPGEYILGWRYDCEATAQVWSNCADVTLV